MSDTIVLFRIGDEGKLQAVLDDDGDIAIFATRKSAEIYVGLNKLNQSGQAEFNVIDVDI